MKRIDSANAVPDMFGPGKSGFRDGNKAQGIPATNLTANYCNGLQEEIANVIEAAGIELEGENLAQLLKALNALYITPTMLASALEGVRAFESGTQMLFIQSAAPTGWTQVTAHNDKALRIVSGAGGGSGGALAFSTAFSSKTISGSVGNTTLTVSQMPYHTHGSGFLRNGSGNLQVPSKSNDVWNVYSTDAAGGNGAHNHSLSINALDMRVQYVDAIICRKD